MCQCSHIIINVAKGVGSVQHVLQPAVEGQVQRHHLFEVNEGTVAASLTILHAQLKVGAEYDQLWGQLGWECLGW